MSLAVENIDQERKEKKENYFLPFLNFIRPIPPHNFPASTLCLPLLNSGAFWNKALNYPHICKNT
jgi:hypothetical protein